MTALDLGISPCPNDTFVFHALIKGRVRAKGLEFNPFLLDVQELNRLAFKGRFHISKLSFHAWLKLKDSYEILDSGAALGRGCGPLVTAKSKDIDLASAKVAIPGELTTAFLLLKLWRPDIQNVAAVPFDQILPGLETGAFDAGLIIHEGRFVYEDRGFVKIVDLGDWWEKETGMPIPLGCLAVKKEGAALSHKKEIEAAIARSASYALENRAASREFIKRRAQEMADDVIDRHIDLYVNDFTLSLGEEGKNAVKTLEEMARWRNLMS
ncbi:1,4-dihydroxy-6-naphtoate synthase [Candidatus Desulfarcum epimagneticum]|uniref:1,4-dihydroxy-6-naphtoate synthase n=1 Tax=uncultured Desulfobacteraceae bacterium TaxID=218296 RepID=A0A484HIX6_9BACT|nr:1,4-dihydroxy-6-naphtoate synthase [uncultured Desulfobacteraceae bacterium]